MSLTYVARLERVCTGRPSAVYVVRTVSSGRSPAAGYFTDRTVPSSL
ncbi:hypothetical protein [Nonomuraea salmonea]